MGGGGDDGALVGSLEAELTDSSSTDEIDFGILRIGCGAYRAGYLVVSPVGLEENTEAGDGDDLPPK